MLGAVSTSDVVDVVVVGLACVNMHSAGCCLVPVDMVLLACGCNIAINAHSSIVVVLVMDGIACDTMHSAGCCVVLVDDVLPACEYGITTCNADAIMVVVYVVPITMHNAACVVDVLELIMHWFVLVTTGSGSHTGAGNEANVTAGLGTKGSGSHTGIGVEATVTAELGICTLPVFMVVIPFWLTSSILSPEAPLHSCMKTFNAQDELCLSAISLMVKYICSCLIALAISPGWFIRWPITLGCSSVLVPGSCFISVLYGM